MERTKGLDKRGNGVLLSSRRAFLAMGVATAGLANAQSISVKSAIQKGTLDPAKDLAAVPDADFDAAVETLETTTLFDDEKRASALTVIQRAIDRMGQSRTFLAGMSDSAPENKIAAIHAEQPPMRWYDRAFDRVYRQFNETTVTGEKPAVWYLYNMGILVKTKTCAFGIDICHRQAKRLAPHLDFLLISHNHGDHFNHALIQSMMAQNKPVISNYLLCWDWYCREFEKTFTIKDITIHCSAADHNQHLPFAVTTFEVVCGNGENPFTIFHSGDCCRYDHLKPRGKPDLYFGHCAIGLNFMDAATKTMPAKLFLPVHHQELGHLIGRWRCVAFQDEPARIVKSLREAGFNAAMPVWGDRIV